MLRSLSRKVMRVGKGHEETREDREKAELRKEMRVETGQETKRKGRRNRGVLLLGRVLFPTVASSFPFLSIMH